MFRRTTPDPTMAGRRPLQPRLMMATGALLAVGALGVALLVGSQRPSGEALAEAAASGAVPGPAAPPAAAAAGIAADPSSSTTTSAPAATGPATTAGPAPTPALPTGPAGPPPTATTAATAARPRPNPAPPAARPAPASADPAAQLRQVQAIADTSGWGWRQVHVNFRIGFDPAACCHWGVYDPSDHKTIWIGPTAFDDPARLRYVVLHELAHAWQWHSHRLTRLEGDMAPWGYSGLDALEAGADCIATDWGADVALGHYWACPPAAQALMASRLAGQWK